MTLFPRTHSYTRSEGTYVGGIWTPGTPTPGTFEGSVQPLTSREVQATEVGRKDLGKVKIYTADRLQVSEEGTGQSGDIVLWDGMTWEVLDESTYQNGLIEHHKYIAEYRGRSR